MISAQEIKRISSDLQKAYALATEISIGSKIFEDHAEKIKDLLNNIEFYMIRESNGTGIPHESLPSDFQWRGDHEC